MYIYTFTRSTYAFGYCLVPLFLTACIPAKPYDLIGESDRPDGPQDTKHGC